MRTRSLRLVLLALLGAAVLAGCSDDTGVGDEPDTEEGASSSTTEAADEPAAEPEGDVKRFCDDIQAVSDTVEEASGAGAPEPGPEEAVALLRGIADQLGAIEPPEAIEDDFEIYTAASDDLATALEGIDPNDEAAADRVLNEFVQEHAESLDEGQRVAAYVEEECGIRFANPLGGG